MKIVCRRNILAYDDAHIDEFEQAREDAVAELTTLVHADIDRYDALNFDIRASIGRQIIVDVYCNERFGLSDALRWRFKVVFDKATQTVTKETSSWSGLQATTDEQLESLQQTVDALKQLNSMPWYDIILSSMPR